MKVEVMKERDMGFICLIQVMICGKQLQVRKQFHTVPDVTCKKKNCFLKEWSFSSNFYEEKVVVNKISL